MFHAQGLDVLRAIALPVFISVNQGLVPRYQCPYLERSFAVLETTPISTHLSQSLPFKQGTCHSSFSTSSWLCFVFDSCMQKPISSQPSDENPVPVTHWRPMGLAEPESQPSSVETSEQAPRKKHSKSVSFSGVDTIFELRSINQDRGSHASEISSRNTPDYHAPRRRSLPPMAKDNKPRAVTNPPKMCFTSIDIPTSKVDPERTGRLRKQCRPRNNNQSRRPNSDSVKHIANHSTTGARPAQDLRMPSSPSWSSRTPLGVQEGLYSEINFTPHIRNFVLRTALLDHSNTQCVTLLDSKLDKNVFGCTSSSRLATFPTPTFKPCNVTIQPSSGKGLGMFTRATVYAGEVFFAEHPTLVVPSNPSILGTETEEVYRNMFSRLSNDVKEQLMCIFGDNFVVSSQNAGKPQPDTGAIRGSVSAHNLISRINHFPIPLSASVPNQIAKHAKDMHSYCGVFLNMCRCNHRHVPFLLLTLHLLIYFHLAAGQMPNGTGINVPSL